MIPLPILVQGVSILLPRVFGIQGRDAELIAQLAAWVVEQIETAMTEGTDLSTVNWDALYGRSTVALRAQVDAQDESRA